MRQDLDYLRSNKQRIEKEIENIKNSLEENKKEIKRLTEENISYEEEQKTLKAALQEITIQMAKPSKLPRAPTWCSCS